MYFILFEVYRRCKKRGLTLNPVQYSRLPVKDGSMTEESAHLLGEEQVEPGEDQGAETDVAPASENGVLARSPQCLGEQTSDSLQEPQEAIAVIAVKSHSPYLLSRMSEEEEEEGETAHPEDPVAIHVPCVGPPGGDVTLHHPEHNTLAPTLVTVDEAGSHPVVVVEEVNETGSGEEMGQQVQSEVEQIAVGDFGDVGDVPIYQEGAGPEVEFGVGVGISEDSEDILLGN